MGHFGALHAVLLCPVTRAGPRDGMNGLPHLYFIKAQFLRKLGLFLRVPWLASGTM